MRTMGGVPVEPVRPLLITSVETCSLALDAGDGRRLPPMVSLTVEVVDPDSEEETSMELGMSQETALLLIRGLSETLVEVQVNTCDDPNCLVHGYGRG